ncbi:MAG: serpin family protein [Eubacteriales bacterium]
MKRLLSLLLLPVVLVGALSACGQPLPSGTTTTAPVLQLAFMRNDDGRSGYTEEDFHRAYLRLSLELLTSQSAGENVLLSPFSILMAMTMVANGADGETLRQMEATLGDGMPIARLTLLLNELSARLAAEPDAKLHQANSAWYADDGSITPHQAFLDELTQVYEALVSQVDFTDPATVDLINRWVSDNTHGMIERILDQIPEEAVMYLINALAFEADWQSPYREGNIRSAPFTNRDGTVTTVQMMYSEESTYLSLPGVKGFLKPYKGGQYSFLALLPDGDADDFVESLDADGWAALFASRVPGVVVSAGIPQFTSAFDCRLNDALEALGITDAFDPNRADLSLIAPQLYISRVLHKTFIQVDGLGTRAGAVTAVEVGVTSIRETTPVILDRPFVYAIIDNDTHLPLFVGTMSRMD